MFVEGVIAFSENFCTSLREFLTSVRKNPPRVEIRTIQYDIVIRKHKGLRGRTRKLSQPTASERVDAILEVRSTRRERGTRAYSLIQRASRPRRSGAHVEKLRRVCGQKRELRTELYHPHGLFVQLLQPDQLVVQTWAGLFPYRTAYILRTSTENLATLNTCSFSAISHVF